MNGVIGMIDLLLDSELSKEQHRYAEIVKFSGEGQGSGFWFTACFGVREEESQVDFLPAPEASL